MSLRPRKGERTPLPCRAPGNRVQSSSPPLAELPAPAPACTFGASFNKTAPIVELPGPAPSCVFGQTTTTSSASPPDRRLPGPVPSFVFGATYINMTRANSVALRAANKSTIVVSANE